jgi:HPt (histidine-containing phosphotransfer) domain-containing protein
MGPHIAANAGSHAVPRAGENIMIASGFSTAAERDRRPVVIDADHLARMTLGDRRLEREVLELFLRQSTMVLERIAEARPAFAAAAAHTLKGSARGIGAWRVARAAELLENAASAGGDAAEMEDAVLELKAASLEAGAAISLRLAGLIAELARDK